MLPITTIMLLQMRRLTKARVIAAERNNPSSYASNKQKALKKLAHKADGWVFQTEEENEWYADKIGNARDIVIPNAINEEFIHPLYGGKREKVVVTVGRLNLQKNQELLVRAFAIVSQTYPDYRLIIYGDGEEKGTLASLSNQLEINDRVEMAGYTNNIGERIKDASLFVLPSNFEGMPNALMEAMALGLPCISTDCDGGGARFLVKNEVNGLLVPKGDVNALASAMERMLSDREFAEQCGREAHKICERLAPEKIYSEWEQFIREIKDIQ